LSRTSRNLFSWSSSVPSNAGGSSNREIRAHDRAHSDGAIGLMTKL
jgi:hypothetical protein